MSPSSRLHCRRLLMFIGIAIECAHSSHASGASAEGHLAVTCDIAARISVDGVEVEPLRAGQTAIVPVRPGFHVVHVTSTELSDVYWEDGVKVELGRQGAVTVQLSEELERKKKENAKSELETLRRTDPARWRARLLARGATLVPLGGTVFASLPQRLLWNVVSGDHNSWDDAWRSCRQDSPDATQGWRLATIDELRDLRRLARGTPLLLPERLWSATENGLREAVYFDIDSGVPVSMSRRARLIGLACVRDDTP